MAVVTVAFLLTGWVWAPTGLLGGFLGVLGGVSATFALVVGLAWACTSSPKVAGVWAAVLDKPLWTRRTRSALTLAILLVMLLAAPITIQMVIWLPALALTVGYLWPTRNDDERLQQDARLDEWLEAQRARQDHARRWRTPRALIRSRRDHDTEHISDKPIPPA